MPQWSREPIEERGRPLDTAGNLADGTMIGSSPGERTGRKPVPRQSGFRSVDDRLRKLSGQGDPLEKLLEIVDFELFRPVLAEAIGANDRARGGRPAFDAVLKFEMLYLLAQHGLSFEATAHLVRDRLSLQGLLALSPSEIG